MVLKAVLSADEFGTLDEVLQGEYKQHADGAYMLDVQSVTVGNQRYALEDIAGITSTLEKHKKWLKDEKAKGESFEGLDAEAAREALSKMEEMQNWKPEQKVQEQIEAIKKQLEGRHMKDAAKWTEQEKFLMNQVEKALIDSAAASAVSRHGVKKAYAELMKEKAKSSAFIEKDESGNFAVRVKGDDGSARVSMLPNSQGAYMDLDEHMGSWAEHDDYAGAFEGTGASGGGASGSDGFGRSGVRPLTHEQASDPVAYRQAKEAAAKQGKDIVDIMPR